MAEAKYRIIGTAGHIDHGKSALVRALTGTDPDRLQEERERGITIDLGFAHLALPGDILAGFVDVPGHERFVKNMLAGIGGIDAVMLVVAADESVMPQTREHLSICELLGVEHGVVAISKCDTVDDELADLVELEVRELLAGTGLRDARIVHTSAETGEGLDQLQEALVAALDAAARAEAGALVRLPVDRVFTVRGFGTVVTGTLLSGSIRTGDKLELLPSRTPVNVRGVQVYGESVEGATSGQRTAVNLQGIQVSAVTRGDLLASPGGMEVTYMIDARLEMLPGHDLEQQQRVRFHHGAAEILCRVAVLQGDRIEAGAPGLVQLRLETPYACAPGDRFVIRRYSPMLTIGGGIVIDNLPAKHRRDDTEVLARLERLESAAPGDRLARLVAAAGTRGIDDVMLRHRLFVTRAELHDLVAETADPSWVVARQEPLLLVDAEAIDTLSRTALQVIEEHHREQPLSPGLAKSGLAAAMPADVPDAVLEALIGRLADTGKIKPEVALLAAIDHEVTLSAEQEAIRSRLIELYDASAFAPPSIAEALAELGVPAVDGEAVFHLLLRHGALVRLRDDLVFHEARLATLVDRLREHYGAGEAFSVADFKELAGVSRKHAIPLLEYLDQQRITRREGDLRVRV